MEINIEEEYDKWNNEVDGLSMSREEIVKLAFIAGYQAAQQSVQADALTCHEHNTELVVYCPVDGCDYDPRRERKPLEKTPI